MVKIPYQKLHLINNLMLFHMFFNLSKSLPFLTKNLINKILYFLSFKYLYNPCLLPTFQELQLIYPIRNITFLKFYKHQFFLNLLQEF